MLAAMATYRPSKEFHVVKPCGERWEDMPGDSRVRHCAVCDRDVLNTAAMTPQQVEAILSTPGQLPCMRTVRHADGSLFTAEAVPKPMRLARIAAAALTATVALTAASAQTNGRPQNVVVAGRILDASGAVILHSTVRIRTKAGILSTAETNKVGEFRFSVPRNESYDLDASAPGFISSASTVLVAQEANTVSRDITLQVGRIDQGEIVMRSDVENIPLEPSTLSSYLEVPASSKTQKTGKAASPAGRSKAKSKPKAASAQ